jgi:hypothetical protein
VRGRPVSEAKEAGVGGNASFVFARQGQAEQHDQVRVSFQEQAHLK